VEIGAFLRRFPPFSELDDARIAAITKTIEIEHFPQGTTILREDGPPADALYVIRKGSVELLSGSVTQDLLGEGENFGTFSLIADESPMMSVRAHEDTLCYLIPQGAAEALLRSDVGTNFILETMVKRIRAFTRSRDRGVDPRLGPVRSLIRRDLVTVDPATTIADAAEVMTRERVSSVLMRIGADWAVVTDRDLRSRVLAVKGDATAPVATIATTPIHTIDANAPSGDALTEMLAKGVHHLPVTDGDRIVGVVTDTDLMGLGRHTPFALKSAISRGRSIEDVSTAGRELPLVVATLVDASADPVDVGRVVSLVVDALTDRFLAIAADEVEGEPVAFAWLALGSAARQEQALHTDQDHALAYALPGGADPDEVDRRLARMAEIVVDGLEAAGIPRCRGGAMAVHPTMRAPVEVWEERFRTWMHTPSPEASVLSSIVFDLRAQAGALDAATGLHRRMREAREHPGFQRMLGRVATTHPPPTGFFGNLVVEGSDGKHAGTLDVKRGGITLVSSLARAWGVEAGADTPRTAQRLEAAAAEGLLPESDASELIEAFRFLWEIRLRHQADQVRSGATPDDFVDPGALGPFQRSGLKEAFRVIRGAQRLLATQLGIKAR
jgi:CBS domain-containing protein